MAILRRTEKAMMRAMSGVKIIDKKRSQELMNLMGLKDKKYFGWASQGQWSAMVWACFENG